MRRPPCLREIHGFCGRLLLLANGAKALLLQSVSFIPCQSTQDRKEISTANGVRTARVKQLRTVDARVLLSVRYIRVY